MWGLPWPDADDRTQCWGDRETPIQSSTPRAPIITTCNRTTTHPIGLCDECYEKLVGGVTKATPAS